MNGKIPAPTGATRLYVIVGDPIAQVRSPAGVSADSLRAAMTAFWFRFKLRAPICLIFSRW